MKRFIAHARLAAVATFAALALVATACGDDDRTRTVTATDYRFEGLPATIEAGTRLVLRNESSKELHEMVVFRIPDGEKRSVEQLVNLPESEQTAIFGEGPPALVMIAPPGGGETIQALGDGKLTEKGRYAVVCFIPTGADPAAYLAAAQSGGDGPPQVAGGPPHTAQGMYGEITVK